MKSPQAEREEKILAFWKEHEIFKKTTTKKSPKGDFIFYEGPPTANGHPGIHHVEARVFKDVIPRYKTMQGYRVPRRAGWDTHGLPVELQVEKELGLKSKKDIESFGVAAFNKKCKESVHVHIDEFKRLTERIAYWTDLNNAYFTFNNSYIESLWSVVSHVDKRELLYKDYKVVPWCARCGTGLSSHELAQGYQDVKDLSVTTKFKVKGQDNVYILAWTTTPWTLPGNVALAVGKDIEYVKIQIKGVVGEKNDGNEKLPGDILLLAKKRLEVLAPIIFDYKIIEEIKGSDLIGLEYEPLYPFLKDSLPEGEKSKLDKAYKVYAADFVTTEDGTGVVHTAVMYGADDFDLGTKVGLPKYHLVEPDGNFKKECGFLAGRFVKDEEVAIDIIKDLAHRGILFKKEKYEHSYPHCWRCKTPLIYYARDSWYIRMSTLRDDLVKENSKINWEPSYIREGRFGEWLKDIKDWAISRERYWGTPLPVWLSEDGSEKLVVDSIDTLKNHAKKSGNKYFVMRHGGTEGNAKGIVSYKNQENDHLTDSGKNQVKLSLSKLKREGIDLIVSSPFTRTVETAKIALQELGLSDDRLVIDERLHEVDPGEFDGQSWEQYHDYLYNMGKDWFARQIPGGESLRAVNKRILESVFELDRTNEDRNILLVTHGGPAWILMASSGNDTGHRHREGGSKHFTENAQRFENAEVRELHFSIFPHDENYELDLHKPYIDEVTLFKNGKELKRVKEVMDVWFDSGAMPFASMNAGYPADFISEAIDQTRGWFYTLHAVGVLMGKGHAYKNVICLGHLMDKNGKKMSKSLGNIIEPMEQIEKFGADAIRLWMFSVNQPGESKNYDERTVEEINKKVFNLVSNVLTFYELYRDKALEHDTIPNPSHVLDVWIATRLNGLISEVTRHLDSYRLLEPVRAIREFIDDLSTWYLQLSRDRFRNDDVSAKQTLYYVLKTLSKVMAPFAPFFAEDLYQKLRLQSDAESVHLEEWPKYRARSIFQKIFNKDESEPLLSNMEKTRSIVSQALDARMKANIKVRQPLASLTLKARKDKLPKEFLELVKDRVNIKEVVYDNINEEVSLNTVITSELKDEGVVRELVRFIQDMRKRQGLTPSDKVSLSISANEVGMNILREQNWQTMLKNAVLATEILFDGRQGEDLVIEEAQFSVTIVR